jgi:proline dehydrogenase
MAAARHLLLAIASNPSLSRRATNAPFVRRSVARFMPGEDVTDALAAAAQLQTHRIATMLTKLGENLTRREDAEEVFEHYVSAMDRAHAAGLDAQISVKPTQLGLDLDAELCARHLQRLVEHADRLGSFVWIDMESSTYVDRTLDLFRQSRERSPRVGVALQAYLYRTESDIEQLRPLGPSIRLVKGAYLEPPSIAFSKKADVDENYYKLSCRLLGDDRARLQIATHDRRLIERLGAVIASQRVPGDAYEYAMLYGIQRSLQAKLAESGRRLRVLISYGENWFPWFMRRLAERPANVWFVLRNML